MKQQHRNILYLLHIGVDTLLIAVSWSLAYWLRYAMSGTLGKPLNPFDNYLGILPLIVPVWLFSSLFLGIYKQKWKITPIERIQNILKSVLLGFLLTSSISFFSKEFEIGRSVVLLSTVINLFLLTLNRSFFYLLEKKFILSHEGVRALIVGAGTSGIRVLQKLQEHSEINYQIVGFLDDNPDLQQTKWGKRPILGTLEDIRMIAEEYQIDEVFMAIPSLNHQHIFPLMLKCEGLSLSFWLLTNDFEVLSRHRKDIPRIDDLPLNYLGDQRINPIYPIFKRTFDLVTAVLLLLVTLPLWLWWSIRIKLDSSGSVFFSQDRVGHNGKLFTLYKFRTMYQESSPYEKAPNTQSDKRITKYGKWLRQTSIDELPQLFNIIKGDMSVVGPRPEMPFIVDTYEDWQRTRLSVKPGLTGLWQISGRKDLPMHENLHYDFYYIRNRSLLLDFSILLRTFVTVFMGKGAY